MQYDSLFSVSKAIAEKMGADSTKKYDSTYSVALEILNRMGSTGGGSSTLESVDAFPTSGVKDGDVVYLKGNAEKADGFYVATLGGDGSATWTMVADDKIGVIKTDSLDEVIKYDDRLFLKKDDDGYNKIYGKYHTDTVIDKPILYGTNYYEATLNITNADWEKYAVANYGSISATIIVPSISQNNECRLGFIFDANLNLTPEINKEYVDIFDIIKSSDSEVYKIAYKTNHFVFCSFVINKDSHSIVFKSGETNTNPFNFKEKTIIGTDLNQLDLSQSEGVKSYAEDRVSQYMPYQDKDGNIIEDGKKLSEKYNPYHQTVANYNYKFPRWNEYGQITGGISVYDNTDTLNGKSYKRTAISQNSVFKWFAPETGGTAGQVLQSNGNAAPIWTDMIKVQKITQDAYDALETKDSNVLYVITN